jgi:hypothetical protein
MGDQLTGSGGAKLEGEFFQVHYRDTFGNDGTAVENVILSHEDDGTWRALSYHVSKM